MSFLVLNPVTRFSYSVKFGKGEGDIWNAKGRTFDSLVMPYVRTQPGDLDSSLHCAFLQDHRTELLANISDLREQIAS